MTQVPTVVKVTVPPLIEQMLADEGSILSVVARPDVDAAVTLYVPPACAAVGAIDPNTIFCVWATINAC
jgi:hypothetical protein